MGGALPLRSLLGRLSNGGCHGGDRHQMGPYGDGAILEPAFMGTIPVGPKAQRPRAPLVLGASSFVTDLYRFFGLSWETLVGTLVVAEFYSHDYLFTCMFFFQKSSSRGIATSEVQNFSS